MSQIYKSTNSGGGVVDSVTGANGVTASPTTGNVVVSGVNATTSTVGVASFNPADFTVSGGGEVTLVAGATFPWTDEATSFAAAAYNGYFIIGTATATLPASPPQGSRIEFAIDSTSAILTIQANTGQMIRVGTSLSASGGTAVSHFDGDSIILIYRAADTTWISVPAPEGTWTVT